MPTTYQLIGSVAEVWPKAEAFAVALTNGLTTGSTIAIEGLVDFAEFTADSVRLDDEDISAAVAGSTVGIKVAGATDFAKTGMRVFHVT